MGCREGFWEVVDGGLADLSVHIVSLFSCSLSLVVTVVSRTLLPL